MGGGERGNGLIVDVDEEDGATGARDGGVGEEVAREAEEKRHGRLQHGQIVQLEDGEEDEGRPPLEGKRSVRTVSTAWERERRETRHGEQGEVGGEKRHLPVGQTVLQRLHE